MKLVLSLLRPFAFACGVAGVALSCRGDGGSLTSPTPAVADTAFVGGWTLREINGGLPLFLPSSAAIFGGFLRLGADGRYESTFLRREDATVLPMPTFGTYSVANDVVTLRSPGATALVGQLIGNRLTITAIGPPRLVYVYSR